MSFADCIIGKAGRGLVRRQDAERVRDRFAELADDFAARRFSYPEAQRRAATRLQAEIERDIWRRRRMRLKQAQVEAEIRARAAPMPDAVDQAMYSVLEFDPSGKITGPAVSQRIEIVRGEAHAAMAEFLDAYRSRAAGLIRNTAGIDDVVRELFGEATSNQIAKAFARGVSAAVARLRGRFNAAGGDIVKRQDWGFFQNHDRSAVAAVSRDEWRVFVYDRLDPERMFDASGQPMTLRSLMNSLDEAYDSIVTGGLADMQRAGDDLFGSSVHGRAARRFLVFKDADAWLEYHARFGRGTLFDWFVGSVQAFARDVGTIEVLGPFPKATLEFMKGLIDEAAARGAISLTGKAAARAAGRIAGPKSQLEGLFNQVTGRAAIAENGIVANISQANRHIVISAVLGGAWFSSLADVALSAVTARMNGLSVARVLWRHLKMFSPTGAADRRTAVRLGFTAQGWASRAIGAQRIMGEVVGAEWSAKVTDTVLKASLLSPWTEAGRWGFQAELLGFITDQAARSWRNLPDALRNTFERHGITPADWELIRTTPRWVDPDTGAEFIRAEDVAGAGEPLRARTGEHRARFEAGNKLQQAIFVESKFAIVETTQRVRALLTAGQPAGTFWGEVMRNSALFKGFPVTVMHLHMRRLMALRGLTRKAQYFAWLFLGTAVMGALGEQLSQIAKGRDPLDMREPRFWAKSAMRGGGLGLFGDFLFADVNRFGGGIIGSLAGPVLGSQLPKAYSLTVGNIQELISEGEARNPGRELSRFIEANLPGRSLWYGRLAMERLIFDELEAAIDPNAAKSFRMIEKRARREYGQRFWWKPGTPAPQRAPELEVAIGGS